MGRDVDRWFTAVVGIVADVGDPEGRHRVRCLIPDIDEEQLHDAWIEPLVPWVGADGYGPYGLPEVNSEVVLFGCKGEKHQFFYLCRFNEDFRPPQEFAGGERGLKTDTGYKLLAERRIEIVGQQDVYVEAAQQADVKGEAVRLQTGSGEMFRVEGDNAGFRGAAIGRRTLPSPGPTDTALTIAIRQLLIDLKLAQ